jgi:hypothetical protein
MNTQSTGAQQLACNVAGFLSGGLGLGEAARLYVAALRSAGVPVQTTSVAVPLPDSSEAVRKEVEFDELTASVDPRFNVVCVNAPELPRFYHDVGPGFFEGKHTVGVWAWETDRVPPEWEWAYSVVDEIWTYSDYVVDVLKGRSPAPVVRVPLPVTLPDVTVPAPDLGLPDRFTFLFLFDFYSTVQRKNPEGLIEAFKRAFQPGEGPQLLVKSFNGDYKAERLEQVQRAAAGHPDIHVIDRYVSRGLRAAARRGDGARQARDRHRVFRQHRLHVRGELLARGLHPSGGWPRRRELPPGWALGGTGRRPRRGADARGLAELGPARVQG